ncbi:MAG: hypothetical protein Q9183_005204 [Haloplaca sp. 2 TL-2023]
MARLYTLTALLVSFPLAVLSIPTSRVAEPAALLRRAAEGEPFQCDNPSAAAAGKQTLLDAGGEPIDIAIAMLENGCEFTGAYTLGNKKVGDSAELGVFRNNWHMLRTYCDHFSGAQANEFETRGREVQLVIPLFPRPNP